MITDGMITDADSTLGVEASQETFEEMCEGIVKEVGQRFTTRLYLPSSNAHEHRFLQAPRLIQQVTR